MTLNGVTVTGLSYFQGTAPGGTNDSVAMVRLRSAGSDSNWLANNVTLAAVPEPSTFVLFASSIVLGLALLGARRRSAKKL